MDRIKELGRYQKILLLLMAVMILAFTVTYPIVTARSGFLYKDAILVPAEEDGCTVYSGKIRGTAATFTVSADKTVIFQYGNTVYGPYTVKEDPTAIPKDSDLQAQMTGIELRCGGEIVFRGGVVNSGDWRMLYNEDGSFDLLRSITATMSDGTMEPSVSTILDLTDGPALTHKGTWLGWFGGVLICVITALTMLFADELFRWNASFLVRNAEEAEPVRLGDRRAVYHMDRAAGHGGGDLHSRIKVICNGAARTFVRAAPRCFFPSKESIYNSLIYISSSTAPALDSGIYRYPPFSVLSFIACFTASGVTAASHTVSAVCKRRVSRPSVLTFGAAFGTF